jgi:hypothetical protein
MHRCLTARPLEPLTSVLEATSPRFAAADIAQTGRRGPHRPRGRDAAPLGCLSRRPALIALIGPSVAEARDFDEPARVALDPTLELRGRNEDQLPRDGDFEFRLHPALEGKQRTACARAAKKRYGAVAPKRPRA